MKKILFILMVMISMTANAYEYPYLILQTVGGSTVDVETATASFEITETQLIITDDGGEHAFDLSSLDFMYFSTQASAITNIDSINENTEVEIFGITGISYGKFSSTSDAVKTLDSGVYVVKSSSKTFKIAVR